MEGLLAPWSLFMAPLRTGVRTSRQSTALDDILNVKVAFQFIADKITLEHSLGTIGRGLNWT